MSVEIRYETSGPFFNNAARQLQDAMAYVMQASIEAGEQRLDETLRPRPAGVYLAMGGSTGNYRRNVQGKLLSNQHALITDGGVVYGPWLEGTGSRNSTTRFKGYASFRKTRDWLEKNIGGVADRVIKRLAERLDG